MEFHLAVVRVVAVIRVVDVTAVTRDVTHALARSLDALRVSKSMCSVDVVLYGNSFCRDSF